MINEKAKLLSESHNDLVFKMIDAERKKGELSIDFSSEKTIISSLNALCDIIEGVTGYRPVILDSLSSMSLSKANVLYSDVPVCNLDVEEIILSDYVESEVLAKYTGYVDKLLQSENLTIEEIELFVNSIQLDIVNDPYAAPEDYESIMMCTEILKGSLVLWNDVIAIDMELDAYFTDGVKASPCKWRRWKKLIFVASADALGGVLGTFVGGVITVGGVPLYVPPGAGTAAFAASLSYIAAKAVCW